MIENDIRSLLNSPSDGVDAPSLELLEHTLTAGYARAMALEAERSRLQRRIADVAMQLAEGGTDSSDLQRLGERLQTVDSELGRLRALLASLRSRASDVRSAAA